VAFRTFGVDLDFRRAVEMKTPKTRIPHLLVVNDLTGFISTARLKSKSTPNVLKATKKALEQYHASGFKVSIIRTN
jgi:hypothetical protein